MSRAHAYAHVDLITRMPEPGRVKTRLIPVLGADGASELHSRMSAHVARQLRLLHAVDGSSVSARIADAPPSAAEPWLGIAAKPQTGHGLGERLALSLADGLVDHRVSAVVGGDCPSVDAHAMRDALAAAARAGAALIPATDGGFCMLALAESHRDAVEALRGDIAWGSERVCDQVVAALRARGIEPVLMPARADVDRPGDLGVWREIERAWYRPPRSLAAIIPALDEAGRIAALVRSLADQVDEVIVADGGSADGTARLAHEAGATVVHAPRGRAAQMNAGAALARSDALLFLHADSTCPEGLRDEALRTLEDPEVLLGAFRFSIDARTPLLRTIEAGANWRARRLGLPYGDQGHFMRRVAFEALGGFPDVRALEDLALADTARRAGGGAVAIAHATVVTSDRAWRTFGALRWTALNVATLVRFSAGAPLDAVAAWRESAISHYSNR